MEIMHQSFVTMIDHPRASARVFLKNRVAVVALKDK